MRKHVHFSSFVKLLFQIVLPIQEQFVGILSDRCLEVGMYCAQSNLVSQDDYEDLRLMRFEGSNGADRLLQLLRGTGNAGFGEFKKILARWKLPMGPAQLLKTIEEREQQYAKNQRS